MKSLPPKWASKLIDWLTSDGSHADIPGDLFEEYKSKRVAKGETFARYYYIWTVLRCLRPFILREKMNYKSHQTFMMQNYWTVTRRFILKNKLYAGINIFGLAIGIACSLVLLIYLSNELSYDRFHRDGDQIYRLLINSKSQEGESTSAIITAAIAPTLKDELPEIIEYARFSYPSDAFLAVEEKKINVENLLYADSTLFDMFSFELEKGDKSTCLVSPYSILLTSQVAKAIFGEEDPIGKNISLNGEESLIVTGIIKEAPTNSQIQYSCLISFSTLEKKGYFLDWNGGWNYFEYVKLAPNTDLDNLHKKFPALMDRHINNMLKRSQTVWELGLQPFLEVHLSEMEVGDWPNKGSMLIIYIFGSVALITLLMASINFINLTISQSLNRLKEIGVRKSIGASKKMLVTQFLFESFLYTIISVILAFLFIVVFYDTINEFLGYQLDQIYLSNIWLALIIILIILIVSVGSGAYPAFILSSMSSLNSLKSKTTLSSRPRNIDTLIIFQFSISIMLIASTWFIYEQIQFVQSKGLGYDKENVLAIRLTSKQASKNLNNLKIELAKIPEVVHAGASSDIPGGGFTSNGYIPEGKELPIMFHVLDIDDSYLETMDMGITNGRNFSNQRIPDKAALLVNETLVKDMGWDEPIGKMINRNGDHEVIGVVQDFNYASLHEKIEPMVFTMAPWKDQYYYLSVRIRSNDIPTAIGKIENVWQLVNTTDPFEFSFLDQVFNNIYYKEQQQAKLLFMFSALAILIGGMGLFGVVSYSLKQKTKEIGVRKVLGATALNLISGISKKYIISIIIAGVLAIPLAYMIMNKWLSSFYYRIDLNPLVFVFSVVITMGIALIIINAHTIIAIRKNPTDSLKYE
jgi:putative ABC transport system permease protein